MTPGALCKNPGVSSSIKRSDADLAHHEDLRNTSSKATQRVTHGREVSETGGSSEPRRGPQGAGGWGAEGRLLTGQGFESDGNTPESAHECATAARQTNTHHLCKLKG